MTLSHSRTIDAKSGRCKEKSSAAAAGHAIYACIWAVDRLLPFDDVDPRVGAVALVGRYVQRRPFALA